MVAVVVVFSSNCGGNSGSKDCIIYTLALWQIGLSTITVYRYKYSYN